VLHRRGIDVPGQVGIVGFDDSSWALRCTPSLSTVRQPAEDLGRRAAQQVLDQLSGTDRPAGVLLPTDIMWRDSA
jgi:DNA-binding LacI/PurR family transcriptional regulator